MILGTKFQRRILGTKFSPPKFGTFAQFGQENIEIQDVGDSTKMGIAFWGYL